MVPRRRKMRHGNPRGGGVKTRKLGGHIFDVCLKCSKTHLQTSLIPKFTPGPPLKWGGPKGERLEGERRGGGLRRGFGGDERPGPPTKIEGGGKFPLVVQFETRHWDSGHLPLQDNNSLRRCFSSSFHTLSV